jgi:predicted permease
VSTRSGSQWLTSVARRLAALWRRGRLRQDLEEELGHHLALRAEHYAAEGLDADEAARAARRRFGNALALREACEDAWTFVRLETLAQDIRFALRVLAKSPGFTAVAVLSLALGIGANTAMFTLLNAMLLRPLPYPAAERLVRLTGFYPKGAVQALQEQSRTLEIAGVGPEAAFNLTGQGQALRVAGSAVSANLFAVLGRRAARGRTFAAGEDRPGRDRLVILGYEVWRTRFGADPSAVGRAVMVDGVAREIVGVMPPGFHFPSGSAQIWIPLRLDPARTEDYWGFGWMPVVARLRPSVTLADAQQELRGMIERTARLFPWPAASWNADATAVPLQEDLVRNLRRKLLVLQAAVGLVLLIACANVANLLLARAAVRRREIAVRAALGAGRARILRQLLTESVTLALLGGAAGMALAQATLSSLQSVWPADTRGFAGVEIDGGVLAFVAGVALACGLAFGLAPAASASRLDLSASMKAGSGRSADAAGTRLRSSFIAAEVALAVVLAIGAGLLIRTLFGLTRADPGFRPGETLAVDVSPDPSACSVPAACVALYDDLLRRVREMRGVSDVAAASAVPLGGEQPLLPVELDGHPLAPGEPAPLVWAGAVTPAYFRLMGIPLREGRAFTEGDAERTTRVVVVSAATAQRYWPGTSAVGRRIRVVWETDWRTVVGVVGDVRQYALSGRQPRDITGALYMPYPQSVALNRRMPVAMTLLARTSADAPLVAEPLRALLSRVNPDMPVGDVRRMDALVFSSAAEPRAMMWLFAAFAGCALLLAAVGTYGIVSQAAVQRSYEIGVRVAVGATRRDILVLVIGHGLRLVSIGLALGVIAALALGRGLASFLYGVTARDPATFAAVAALLVLTGLAAGYVPGRRAAATDPVRALRAD